MVNSYNIGGSTGPVILDADINSIGVAGSRAIVLLVAGTDNGTAVAHSAGATGDIAQANIGSPAALKGLRLSVFTKIALLGTDEADRAKEAANVSGTYTLDGGDDGLQTFTNPVKTFVDPNVFLTFLADLV